MRNAADTPHPIKLLHLLPASLAGVAWVMLATFPFETYTKAIFMTGIYFTPPFLAGLTLAVLLLGKRGARRLLRLFWDRRTLPITAALPGLLTVLFWALGPHFRRDYLPALNAAGFIFSITVYFRFAAMPSRQVTGNAKDKF